MITLEFESGGKTYLTSLYTQTAPPATVRIYFKPCPLKPTIELELIHVATDDIRHIELYRPAQEVS